MNRESSPLDDHALILRITELLSRSRHVEHGQGASIREVMEAERRLGVAFPREFQLFLTHFGWLSFDAEDVFGLGSECAKHMDIVQNWKWEYEEAGYGGDLPAGLVPLYNNGAGDISFLDTSRSDGKKCPVVTHWHETQEIEQIADSFGVWLCELIAESNRDS